MLLIFDLLAVPSFEDVDKNRDGHISEDEYDEIFQTHGLTIGKKLFSFNLNSIILEFCTFI